MSVSNAQKRGRKWLFLAAALLLTAGGLGAYLWSGPRAPEPPEIPLQGVEPELADVVRKARAAVLDDPRSGKAWAHLGRALLANAMHAEICFVCFREAERLDPKNPRWPYFAGGSLLTMGKPEEAVVKLRRAVELCDRLERAPPTPRLLLAETLLSLGQNDAAEGQFREVLNQQTAEDVRAQFGLGLVAAARADWPQCRSHLETCLGSPRVRQKACTQLALVCERLEDRASADRYTKMAADFPKDLGWADPFVAEHARLGRRRQDRYRAVDELQADGRYAEAAEILRQIARERPDDYLPHVLLGRILPQMGQFEAAEEHLNKARALAPDKIQVHYLMSLVLLEKGEALLRTEGADPAKARALFEGSARAARRVLALKADYGFAHMALGRSLKHLGHAKESLAALREAVHCNPEYADNHLYLGIALREAGDLPGARSYLEQAQLLAPPQDRRPAEELKRLGELERLRAKEGPSSKT